MPPTIPPLADLFLPDKRLKASGPDHGEVFASSLDLANANTAHGPDGSSGADAPKETNSPTDSPAQAEIRERAKIATERDNETRATDKALEQQGTEARHATERAETRADESAEAARRADSRPSRTDETDRPAADVTKDVTKDVPASSSPDPLAKLAASSGLISAPVALDHGSAAAKPAASTTSAAPAVLAIPTVPSPAAAQAGPAAAPQTTLAPTTESKGQPSTTPPPSAALSLAATATAAPAVAAPAATAIATAAPATATTAATPAAAAAAAAIAATTEPGQAKPLGKPGELGQLTDAAAAAAAAVAKENGQPLAVGARGTGPAAPPSPGSSPAPALATATSTAPVHAAAATDTVGRAESRPAASSSTATPVVPPGQVAQAGAAAPLDSAPVATTGVATADAFISSIMMRLRTFGHPGYPGVAARFSHPDFGAMQLTVAGRAGERVEATLIVRDQATAQLVNAAANRLSSASPEAWNGIALHVRAEGQQAGAADHSHRDQTDRGPAAVQVIVRTPARRARVIGIGMDGRTHALDIDA